MSDRKTLRDAHIVICQKRLVHYRLAFFERLRERLAREGVRLSLVHGAASAEEALRQDGAELPWAESVRLREFFGGRAYWMPLPKGLRGADLVVVTQENKILSNYARQLARPFRRQRLAFWGHGRNFQSGRPGGWRERWKRFWTGRVDWWFAYTELSRRAVEAQGYAPERITVLNNAIDGEGFRADLAGTGEDLPAFRAGQGIALDAPVAIYCGSLYEDKRLGLLVAAGEIMAKRLPGFRLLVLGAGPEENMLRAAATTRPWLCLLGMRKGRDKALAFRAASVLLNPGAVGLHVIDSFISGCPLVSLAEARHGPEIAYLEHGRNALLLDRDDAGAFADAACGLLADAGRLAAMRAACEEAGRRYTLDAMVENFARGALAALAAPKR
ncbi:MAG: glycosyltransferase family 4 protein [Paucibacter sp.]|nr:glycosyltransferase family 4 protein [Roseateles sp.]